MSKRILGLDPGLAILGFGILDYDPLTRNNREPDIEVVDFGVIQTPAGQEVG